MKWPLGLQFPHLFLLIFSTFFGYVSCIFQEKSGLCGLFESFLLTSTRKTKQNPKNQCNQSGFLEELTAMNEWPKSSSHISNSLLQTLVCALESLSVNDKQERQTGFCICSGC